MWENILKAKLTMKDKRLIYDSLKDGEEKTARDIAQELGWDVRTKPPAINRFLKSCVNPSSYSNRKSVFPNVMMLEPEYVERPKERGGHGPRGFKGSGYRYEIDTTIRDKKNKLPQPKFKLDLTLP